MMYPSTLGIAVKFHPHFEDLDFLSSLGSLRSAMKINQIGSSCQLGLNIRGIFDSTENRKGIHEFFLVLRYGGNHDNNLKHEQEIKVKISYKESITFLMYIYYNGVQEILYI